MVLLQSAIANLRTSEDTLQDERSPLHPRMGKPMKESSMKKILVTGSSGLIGSEVCLYFAAEGWKIHGIDNNQRAVFFGPKGDTRWNQHRLQHTIKDFVHHELDIRDRQGACDLVKNI